MTSAHQEPFRRTWLIQKDGSHLNLHSQDAHTCALQDGLPQATTTAHINIWMLDPRAQCLALRASPVCPARKAARTTDQDYRRKHSVWVRLLQSTFGLLARTTSKSQLCHRTMAARTFLITPLQQTFTAKRRETRSHARKVLSFPIFTPVTGHLMAILILIGLHDTRGSVRGYNCISDNL